jgi:hypothetical protein
VNTSFKESFFKEHLFWGPISGTDPTPTREAFFHVPPVVLVFARGDGGPTVRVARLPRLRNAINAKTLKKMNSVCYKCDRKQFFTEEQHVFERFFRRHN